MHARIDKRYVLPTLWSSGKIFRGLCSGLFVEQSGIGHIKKLMNMNERVVILPQYKSFADLFVLLYTLNQHDIEIPFFVGNMEDTPRIGFIDMLLKGVGYINVKRTRDQST